MKNQATNNIWLVSRGFDSCVFLIPIALALLVTPIGFWYYPAQIPLWAFIFVIITFDVAHVWATAYRVYLDKDEFQRRFWFYFLPLPAFFFLALGLCCYDMTLYWTLLAYTAIFHFIKQPYGFVAIYKQKLHERCKLDYYLDKWAVWCAGLGPVILWHGSPQRVFDWFNAGESFLLKVPPSILPYVTFFYGLTLVFYVGRQLYLYKTTKFVNHGKNLVMMG
ncbi:hypothetical protein HOF92_08225, partial [bacterium]|nr:hypothetical protein [bacterium]